MKQKKLKLMPLANLQKTRRGRFNDKHKKPVPSYLPLLGRVTLTRSGKEYGRIPSMQLVGKSSRTAQNLYKMNLKIPTRLFFTSPPSMVILIWSNGLIRIVSDFLPA